MSSFYQNMTQAEYNALLEEGAKLYVPDKVAMAWLKIEASSPLGIPATATLAQVSDGVVVWKLIPEADTMAAHWHWCVCPTPNGKCVVMRMPKGTQEVYPVCGLDELYTLQQEATFRLLMTQSGTHDLNKEEG